MEATVTGPATAAFEWRLIGPDGRGWMTLEVDGREMATLRRAVAWQKVEINVPPGGHMVRLRAHGMARVPGSAAEADRFVLTPGARLPWLSAIGDDPDALWVVTGSGSVTAGQQMLTGIDDGAVAAVRGTDGAGRTSLRRLVQGPARLTPWMNVKGGSFTLRDLDAAGTARRVSASTLNTWNDAPLIVGPGLHRVEWTHFYWSEMEQEKDPYPTALPPSIQPLPNDVATLASLSVTPLSPDTALPGGQGWSTSGTVPWVVTAAALNPNTPTAEQSAAIAIEAPGPEQQATLTTTIAGPAELRVHVVFSGPPGDVLRIRSGGVVKYEATHEGSTGSQIFEIPAEPVTVEIEWQSGTGTGWPRQAEVKELTIRAPLPEAARTAMGSPGGVTFFTPNPELWETALASPREGSAARCARLPLNPMAFPELSAWVDGPAILTYWRKAEVPEGSSLPFPGIPDQFNPGALSWTSVTVPVPAGRHRLAWYSPLLPGGGFFGPAERVWLDDFSLQPGQGPQGIPLDVALDTPGRVWTSSGSDVAPGNLGELALDGVDAVQMTPLDEPTPAWVETTVTGPALFSIHSSQQSLTPRMDGEYPALGLTQTPVSDGLWHRTTLPVPEGVHTVRILWSDPNHPLRLDMAEVVPQPPLSISDAVEAPELNWTADGVFWKARNDPTAPDGDAVFASGQGTGSIRTSVSGPARLRFNWRAGPEYTRLTLEVDGQVMSQPPPYGVWEPVTVEVPAGEHEVRWVFSNPGGHTGGTAALNEVAVTPLDGLSLAEALDAPGQVWLTGGEAPQWAGQPDVSHDGGDAAFAPSTQEESISPGSVLQTSLTGPAVVRFWWRKDRAGQVLCYLDRREVASLTQENTWQEVMLAVPPGTHTLKWSRVKNHYFEQRAGLYVDDFRTEPAPQHPGPGAAVDAPALPWRTSVSAPWQVVWRELPEGGVEPAASSAAVPGETSWIETDVTGPGVLSFLFLDDNPGFSLATLQVDGADVLTLSGGTPPGDAIPVRWPLPAGTHTVRWSWAASAQVPFDSSSANRLMLDRVHMATDRPDISTLFPVPDGLSFPGTHPWTVQPASGGGYRAESNPVSPGQSSSVEMNLPGGGEVSFRSGWAGLRTNHIGGCFLAADGVWYDIHGLGGNQSETMDAVWHLPPGSHDLRWSAASAQGVVDAFYLEQVTLTSPALTAGGVLGLPHKTFLTWGDSGRWNAQTENFHTDGAALISSGSGNVITQFTGPGTVSWWWKSEGAPAGANAYLLAWPYNMLSVHTTSRGSFGWERHEVILPDAQTFRLEWRYLTPGGGRLVLDEITFREAATDTYTLWAARTFTGGGEKSVMSADPDGDGQTNLMEFAFGSDPWKRRSAYMQSVEFMDGFFHVCLTMPDYNTTGLLYDIETSPDLQTWTRVDRVQGGVNVPGTAVVCAAPAPAGGSPGFVRIRVTMSGD